MRTLLAVVPGCLLAGLATLAAPVPDAVGPRVDPARHKGYTEKLAGSKVTFDVVAVPGGVYRRGSDADEAGRRADEGPTHLVEIAPFWMGKCEVTWDEFDLFMKPHAADDHVNEKGRDRNPDAITRPTAPYIDETWNHGREGYPVIGISHHAAMEYCWWLYLKTGKKYRLPTEAEWEWACRAGATTRFSFGDDADKLGDHAWYAKNADETTHPVGKKKPNPWGLHDLHGNVWEWCVDQYKKDAYAPFSPLRPTPGPVVLPTDQQYPHVVRGGAFMDDADQCRSATRRNSDPTWNKSDPQLPQSIWWLGNVDYVGFRVVRAVEEQKDLVGLRSKVRKYPKEQPGY